MNHKVLDPDSMKKKETDIVSMERRSLCKKTGKMIYSAPLIVLLSGSADALTPPPPPAGSDSAALSQRKPGF